MKPAKKFICLLLFSLPVLFMACNEDDEPSREELLIGTWQLQSQKIISVIYNGTEITEDKFALIESTLGIEIPDEYFADSTTLTLDSENTYEIYEPEVDNSLSGSWSLSSNEDTLNLTLNNEQAFASIEELTRNKLDVVLSVENVEFEDGSQYGGKIRLSFNKE